MKRQVIKYILCVYDFIKFYGHAASNDDVTLLASSSCSDYKFLLQQFLPAGNGGQRNGYLGKQEQRFIPL